MKEFAEQVDEQVRAIITAGGDPWPVRTQVIERLLEPRLRLIDRAADHEMRRSTVELTKRDRERVAALATRALTGAILGKQIGELSGLLAEASPVVWASAIVQEAARAAGARKAAE